MLEWLKTILGEQYTEDIDKAVSAEIGRNFVSRADFNAKAGELKTAADQLAVANTTIRGYQEADWETRYNADTQKLQSQLEQAQRGYAAEMAASGKKFTSESARKQYIAEMLARNLALEDGKFTGLENFDKEFQETDPGAFASEQTPPPYASGTGTAPVGGMSAPTTLAGALKERYAKG